MSSYAAKLVHAAEIQAHLDQWSLFVKIAIFWAVGYLVFFLWMGIVKNRTVGEIPHSWGILWTGLAGTYALMFLAIARFGYWNNVYMNFLEYFN